MRPFDCVYENRWAFTCMRVVTVNTPYEPNRPPVQIQQLGDFLTCLQNRTFGGTA